MPVPAGRAWCDQYPTSRALTDLVEPFQSGVRKFLARLVTLGCSFTISATYRPPERAYLMHWAYRIWKGLTKPEDVPPHEGIDILWTVEGATEMAETYDLVVEPSLDSRHCHKRAIDVTIKGWPSGKEEGLYALGASFGVRKLRKDRPHWSDDGH